MSTMLAALAARQGIDGTPDELDGLAASAIAAGSQQVAAANDVEAIQARLLTKMVVKFQALKWVGVVEIKGILKTPVLNSTFFVQGQFGVTAGSVTVTEETVVEPIEQKTKWWEKKLKEKLKYMKEKLENVAYNLREFRLTGRIGVIFNLLAPTLLTGGITIGFEVKIEIVTESIVSSITSEEWLRRKKEKIERKIQKKRTKQEAKLTSQGSHQLLSKVAPCVVKKIEQRKQRKLKLLNSQYEDLTEEQRLTLEKKKDDIAVQKMLLSVQATRMKIDSLGWIGFVKAQIDLGLCSFFIQVNFFKTVTQLAFNFEPQLPPQVLGTTAQAAEAEAKENEEPAKRTSAGGSKFLIGNYRGEGRTEDDLSKSGESPTPARESSNPSLLLLQNDLSVSADATRGTGDAEVEVEKPDNAWVRSWSKIVALVDLADKEEEDMEMEQMGKPLATQADTKNLSLRERETLRERGFKKGLELGINSINKLSKANFRGIHSGGKIGATFQFNVFGFGIQTAIEVEMFSVRTF